MSTFEIDVHLHAEHRYTAGGGVVGCLLSPASFFYCSMASQYLPEQWVDAGSEKFSKMRIRSRLIPAMFGCDWKTDVLDLAGKSWDDACPTVRRSPSCFTISSKEMRFASSQAVPRARSLREGCSSRRVNLARFLARRVSDSSAELSSTLRLADCLSLRRKYGLSRDFAQG